MKKQMKFAPLQPMSSDGALQLMKGPATPDLRVEQMLYRMLRKSQRECDQLRAALSRARERYIQYRAVTVARGVAKNLTRGLSK